MYFDRNTESIFSFLIIFLYFFSEKKLSKMSEFRILSLLPGNGKVFSPMSLFAALGCIYLGSGSTTRQQLKDLFGFKEKSVTKLLKYLSKEEEFKSIIYLAISDEVEINEEYKDKIGSLITLKSVEMNSDTSSRINKFASKNTNGLIKSIVSPEDITANTKLILVNCIYFQQEWEFKFSRSKTKNRDFTRLDKSITSVKMMNSEYEYQYFENDKFQFIILPYKGDCTMQILLPKMSSTEIKLEDIEFSTLRKKSRNTIVNLFLPKFRQEYTFRKDTLLKFGCKEIFSEERSDLSGISNDEISVRDLIQKTVVIVDEAGTKAASVTELDDEDESFGDEDKIIVFDANHSFIYLICDYDDKIVFIGQFDGEDMSN